MSRFFIYFHGNTGSVDSAVPCKSLADNFMGFFMGNQVVKLQPHPFEYRGTGVDTDGIIIMKGAVIGGTDFNDRIYIPVFLDLAIRISGVAHQRRPAEL